MREPQFSDSSGNIQSSFAPHVSDLPLFTESDLSLAFSEARNPLSRRTCGAYDDVAWHHMLSDLNLRHAES